MKIEYFGFVAHLSKAKLRQTCQVEQSEGKGVRSAMTVAMSKRQARRPYRKFENLIFGFVAPVVERQ